MRCGRQKAEEFKVEEIRSKKAMYRSHLVVELRCLGQSLGLELIESETYLVTILTGMLKPILSPMVKRVLLRARVSTTYLLHRI
jgi:hypothetical protein